MTASVYISVPHLTLKFNKKNLTTAMRNIGQEEVKKVKALLGKKLGAGHTSTPGNPPANVTGLLARSVKSRVGKDGMSVMIYDSAFYSKFLETGATGGGGKLTGIAINKAGVRRQRRQRNIRGVAQTTRVLLPRPFISTQVNADLASIDRRLRIASDNAISYKVTK